MCIDLHVLPIIARIKYKFCLLALKAVQCKEPLYLNEMLELWVPSTINLRSNYGTWKLVENRVPGPGFTNRSLKYFAPHLYNTLPKTIRQLDNTETFKKQLKMCMFSETFYSKLKQFVIDLLRK